MAHNFKILFHRNNGNLFIHPRGTLDGSSAWQLINLIDSKYEGQGNVFVETKGLTEILPFAARILKLRLNGAVPRAHLIFKGEKGYEIAPTGCRVLITARKPSCCKENRCGSCRCSGQVRNLKRMPEEPEEDLSVADCEAARDYE